MCAQTTLTGCLISNQATAYQRETFKFSLENSATVSICYDHHKQKYGN
jgi:hypothetical protein